MELAKYGCKFVMEDGSREGDSKDVEIILEAKHAC